MINCYPALCYLLNNVPYPIVYIKTRAKSLELLVPARSLTINVYNELDYVNIRNGTLYTFVRVLNKLFSFFLFSQYYPIGDCVYLLYLLALIVFILFFIFFFLYPDLAVTKG